VYGRAPDAAEARREVQANDSVYTLDRWLMNWEERQRHQPSTRNDRYLNWFWDGGPLVFLPARRSAEVCVYLDFWGEQASPGATPAAIAQIIDYWALQYDAQLIANWGTMLQFVVARPPDNLEQAWQLAVEQDLVAPHTLANPGVSVREHARILIDRPTWFLHSRP
jgi:Domain of unknown function (DUF4253)